MHSLYIFFLGWHQPNVLIHMFCWHCRKCKEELNQEESNIHVDKRVAKGFAKWFKNHVRSLATCFDVFCVIRQLLNTIVCVDWKVA